MRVTRRTTFFLLASWMATACAWAAGQGAPAQECAFTPGPYTVAATDNIVLRDAARDKDRARKAYYPEEPGPFPVIVFSHGAGHSKEAAP